MKTYYVPEDFVFNSVEEAMEAYPDQAVSCLVDSYEGQLAIKAYKSCARSKDKTNKKYGLLLDEHNKIKLKHSSALAMLKQAHKTLGYSCLSDAIAVLQGSAVASDFGFKLDKELELDK